MIYGSDTHQQISEAPPLDLQERLRGPQEANNLVSEVDLTAENVVPFNQNFTKHQIIRQRGSVFLNNTNSHSQASRFLIEFLEEKNLAHTGTDLRFYELTREELVVAASCCGLRLPYSDQIYDLEGLASFQKRLPLMVKPDWELDSVQGKQENFLVENIQELKVMAATMIQETGGAILEQYVDGREVVCLCYSMDGEVKSLKPVEFNFGETNPRVITMSLKNDPIRKLWYEPLQNLTLEKQLRQKIQFLFKILNLSGEFLFTIRIQQSQFFLISCKPVVLPLQSGVRPFRTSGLLQSILYHNNLTKKGMLSLMVKAAISRQQQRKQNFAVRYSHEKKRPVLVATRPIASGGVVYQQENVSQKIVILEWIKDHYGQIAWGDLWNSNSRDWRPISHSCDPNSIAGQNEVLAVKPIAQGEEITIDLSALFFHDLTLQCNCGSVSCRKIIKFKDHHEDWFKAIPQSHLHPWMIDFTYKETMVNLVNATQSEMMLAYEPGNCFAVAKRDIVPGEIVVDLSSFQVVNQNARHNITKDKNQFWETQTSVIQYLNHKCCNYNLIIKQDNSGFVAATKISKGQILSFNYLTTEWNVCFPFSCLCQEPRCFRTIKGFKNMTKYEQAEIYKTGHCSAFIKRMFEQEIQ